MTKIPIAEELLKNKETYNKEYPTISLSDAKEAMIEYAKFHVKAALEAAANKTYETYHTICEDGTTKGVFKTQKEALDLANKLTNETVLYHDWTKVTRLGGGMSKDSILNAYPENLIV